MQKEPTKKAAGKRNAGANPPRKLSRAEKKQIAEVIRQAKGDGKAHTAQQTIPYLTMYPDGICKVSEKKYSKSIAFEDINYQLAQAVGQRIEGDANDKLFFRPLKNRPRSLGANGRLTAIIRHIIGEY